MASIEAIVEGKYLSVCSPPEAINWLKEKRAAASGASFLSRPDTEHQEGILAKRNEALIDFGLARYGMNADALREVYARADKELRITFLAHFPNGGFREIFEVFDLSPTPPSGHEELCALAFNKQLSDQLIEHCLCRTGVFEGLKDEEHQNVLVILSNNKRLSTPYDDTWLDGYADYSYHRVFSKAWELAATVPVTPQWASVLSHLLSKCHHPRGFDPIPVLGRWHFPTEGGDDGRDLGFYVRSLLADLLKADDALLKSSDAALRESFYRRFQPSSYPKWPALTKDPKFLEAAVYNDNLWRTRELRETLGQLCWRHPDPNANMDMPNSFRSKERHTREAHPEWFKDERGNGTN